MAQLHTRCFLHDIRALLSIIQFIKSDQWRDFVPKMRNKIFDSNSGKLTRVCRERHGEKKLPATCRVLMLIFSLEFPCVLQQPPDIMLHHTDVKNAAKPFEIKIFYGFGFGNSKRFISNLSCIEMYFNLASIRPAPDETVILTSYVLLSVNRSNWHFVPYLKRNNAKHFVRAQVATANFWLDVFGTK